MIMMYLEKKDCIEECINVKIQRKQKNKNVKSNIGRELKRFWNMMMTVIPILVGTLGMVLKEFEIRRIKDIQTTLLRSA